MTSSTRMRALLATLAAGSALALAGACGAGGGGSDRAFRHAASFVVTGSHQGFTCDQCHAPAAASYSLAGGGVTCVGCHKDADVRPRHPGVAGYVWSDASCIACHKDGTAAGLPANHNAQLFPITGTKHQGFGCSQCHGPTKAVQDLSCIPCHDKATMDAKHSAVPTSTTGGRPAGSGATRTSYQYLSTACVRCHADGQVNSIAQHPSTDGGFNNQRHQPFCLTCHQASRATGNKPWGVEFKAYSCLDCHTNNSGGGAG